MSGPVVNYEQHPRGNTGSKKSVRKTVQAAAAGRLSVGVAKWSHDILLEAGLPQSKADQAAALLNGMRRDKFYIPDPVDAERVVLPDCLLADCDGLKMDGGDCDDLSAALAAAMESIGIVAAIIGQAFDKQQHYQHILVACEIDDGVWMYADPSDKHLLFGQARSPSRELWLLVPSGKVLCDHAPNCASEMKGVHPDVHDRPMGDAVWVGGDLAGPPEESGMVDGGSGGEDVTSFGWTVVKTGLSLTVLGLAVFGGYKLATR